MGSAAALLRAQVAVSVRSGLIHHVEGQVWAQGAPLDPDSPKLRQLAAGETLETRRGRVELLLGPQQFARLGPHARLTLVSDDINAPEFQLEGGSAIVSWPVFGDGEIVTIRTSAGTVRAVKPGIYRFDIAEEGASRLRVFEGKAVFGERQTLSSKREIILAGERKPAKFDANALDGFDRWSRRRDRVVRRQGRSGGQRRGRERNRSRMPSASERTPPRVPPFGAPTP